MTIGYSVIIPAHNEEVWLPKSLLAFQAAKIRALGEVVFMPDCSFATYSRRLNPLLVLTIRSTAVVSFERTASITLASIVLRPDGAFADHVVNGQGC